MEIYYTSVKGPKKEKLQDAIKVINQQEYALIIVADGLGSAMYSDYGAQQALIAVEKAVEQWRVLKKKKVPILIQLIHFFWNLLIADSDFEKKDCLTTCLFSLIDRKNNQVVLAQLGDGLIFYESNDEISILKSIEEYNFTKSLGKSKAFNDWNIRILNYTGDFKLLIATDGISEDIEESKEKEFTDYLLKEILKMKRKRRNNYLKEKIENWPTKFHSDDKTICIGWNERTNKIHKIIINLIRNIFCFRNSLL